MKKAFAIIIPIVIIIGFGVAWRLTKKDPPVVTNFEECVLAGNPVMESYPRQCRHGEKLFVEDIGNELEKTNLIRVDSPRPNQFVASSLVITGEARGGWFFEANFPVSIFDANGNVLGEYYATAQGEWMTNEFVRFEAKLAFSAPTTTTGTLVLYKSNASGLPEHADELRIPVQFELDKRPQRTVRLYYYDPQKDSDASGNIMCSDAGLVAVERSIPITQTPIQDTIRLLLAGELTPQEKARGITTEYPLPGLELRAASLNNGVLTLTFSDPNNATGGGSCRVGILWFQIRETAKQFDGVDEVRFRPEELFQP